MANEDGAPERGWRTSSALVKVGSSSLIALAIGLARGLLYSRALDPASRGMVQLVLLVAGYVCYLPLAVYFGLEKAIPVLLGQSKREEAGRLERAGVTAVVALAGGAGAVMVAYGAWGRRLPDAARVGLAIGAVYLVLSQLVGVHRVVLRSHLQFGVVAISTLVEAVTLCVLVVGGAALLGAPGAVAGWAVGLGVVGLHLAFARPLPAFARPEPGVARQVLKIGLPVMGVALANTFLRTADNLVVARRLGMEALGYYGLAWQLASYLYNAAGAADAVITPRVYRSYGEGAGPEMRRSVMRMTSAFGTTMPCLAAVGAVAAPLVVRLVLPRYVAAIPPLQVFMFTVVLLAIPMAMRPVLVAANRELEYIVWDSLGGLIIAVLVWALIDRDPNVPLVRLALAGGVGLAFSAIMVTVRGLRELGVSGVRTAVYVLGLLAPLAYGVACVGGARWLAADLVRTGSAVARDALALVLAGVGSAPLIWVAERQTGVISAFRSPRGPGADAGGPGRPTVS